MILGTFKKKWNLVRSMTNYTRLAVRGATIVLVISLVAAFLGYVVRFVLARNLSVEEFGLFYAVFSFLGLLGVFKSLGFDKALAKFIPEFLGKKEHGSVKGIIFLSCGIQFITNILILLVVYLLSDYLSTHFFKNEAATTIIVWLAIAFFLDSFLQVLKFAFQGFKNMVLFSGIDVVRMIALVVLILFGFHKGYGLLSPVIAYIVTSAVLLPFFYLLFTRKVYPLFSTTKARLNRKLSRKVRKYSLYVMATTVAGVVLGYTDIMMLTHFTTLTAVGLYSVALPTAKVLLYFPRAFGGILLPLTSELWNKKNDVVLRSGIEALLKYSFVAIIPIVLAMLSFSNEIINVLFGKQYVAAAPALEILSIGMVFGTLVGVSVNVLNGIGQSKLNSLTVYSAAVGNFFLNLLLIPLLGFMGAAIATTISYGIMLVVGMAFMKKHVTFSFPFVLWGKTLVSGFLFTGSIWVLKQTLELPVLVETGVILFASGTIYILLIFLLRIVRIKELQILISRLNN